MIGSKVKLIAQLLIFLCVVLAVFYVSIATGFAQTSNDSFTIGLQVGIDTDAPTVPADVTATPVAETQVDVEWTASSDTFGVVGYQVFRDAVQITTTADTIFSDTGLTASTTYSYTIQAFDAAGNVSSSSVPVATTTFATAPTPPPATTTPDSSSPSGTILLPVLEDFQIEAGATAAEITFSTNQPVRYVLRYGITDVLDGSIVETATYKRDHSIVLQNLESNKKYLYELYGTDRFGRELLLQKASFMTASLQETDEIVNVANFTGVAIENDVVLRWQLTDEAEAAFVRIVRNSRFFPQSPTDGEIVYEGDAAAYVDADALQAQSRQFYSIFAYNLSGKHSSGRVVRVDRVPTTPDMVDPDTVDDAVNIETATPPAEMEQITASAVSLMQFNQIVQPDNRTFTIVGSIPYYIRLLATETPQFTRNVMVTIFAATEPETFFTYVLRKDEQVAQYTARLPGLDAGTEYSFIVRAYTVSGEVVGVYEGSIVTTQEPTTSSDAGEDVWQLWLLYILTGSLLGLLLLASVQYLFEVVVGRKKWRH